MRHVSMIILSLLLTLLAACGHRESPPATSDRDIQKKLTGTWISEGGNSEGDWFRSVTVIALDGGYVAEGTITRSNETRRWASEAGTYLAKNGALIVTMTNSSSTNGRLPHVDRQRLVRLDDRELVVIYEERPDVTVTNRKER